MASLTLTIGALTATVSAGNAKASDILTQYAASIGASGTNQEKAYAVVRSLVRHMQQQGQRHRSNEAAAAAIATAQTEIDALVWE